MTDCQFCKVPDGAYMYTPRYFYAKLDPHPLTKGHTLLIPKRHVLSIRELQTGEQLDFLKVLYNLIDRLWLDFKFDGFNIGINDGPAAGRTIHHLHVHVIPRYSGDVSDPRGGIRNMLPGPSPDLWSVKSD